MCISGCVLAVLHGVVVDWMQQEVMEPVDSQDWGRGDEACVLRGCVLAVLHGAVADWLQREVMEPVDSQDWGRGGGGACVLAVVY